MPDNCPVCNKPLSTHPDGLACCPCCGGKNISGPQRDVESQHWSGAMATVACVDCGLTAYRWGDELNDLNENDHRAMGEVAEKWNRRAQHAETLALRAENERLMARVKELEDGSRDAIRAFCDEVERRAESKMLKTGKLEGAHYAAMKQLLAELQEPAHD